MCSDYNDFSFHQRTVDVSFRGPIDLNDLQNEIAYQIRERMKEVWRDAELIKKYAMPETNRVDLKHIRIDIHINRSFPD